MWKQKLQQRSLQLSPILSRSILFTNSTSAIHVPRHNYNYNLLLFDVPRTFSSSVSSSVCFRGGGEVKSLICARILLFGNPSSVERGKPYSAAAEKVRCWNCGAGAEETTPFLFCQGCRSVQPVDRSVDYFEIFGLERRHDIVVDELEKKYKDWQKKLHPDLVHSKSQREREYAAEQSARVIDAYRTLTDPLLRAIYIVKLEGMHVDEEERITDPELLAEVMELREAVDEAQDSQALKEIQAQLQEKLRYWSHSFEEAYLNKNYEDAVTSIRRMTYYKRTNEAIVKKL